MDADWLQRLCDHTGPLGSCFLVEYARGLRLLSGLSRVGYLRAHATVRHQRLSQAFRAAVLNHREFTSFLSSFDEQEIPVVCEVVTQRVFPDAPERGLSRAARIDPLAHPELALTEASNELDEIETLLRPADAVRDSPPEGREFPDKLTWMSERWASVVAGMDRTPNPTEALPSMISGVAGPAFSHVPDFANPVIPQVITPSFVEYERRRRRQIESQVQETIMTPDPPRDEQPKLDGPMNPASASSTKPPVEDPLTTPSVAAGTVEPNDKKAEEAGFVEVPVEPLHHPTPPTGVPEPLLPPKRRHNEDTSEPPKRKETGSADRARKESRDGAQKLRKVAQRQVQGHLSPLWFQGSNSFSCPRSAYPRSRSQ